jgi:hypothetical protein
MKSINKQEDRKMKQITIEQVYETAIGLAPKVMNKLGFKEGSFQTEDIVGEYIVKFIEKNYLERFDAEKGNLKNYVYCGLKNTAISMIRKVKYEFEVFQNEGTTDSYFNIEERLESETIVYGDKYGKKKVSDSDLIHNDIELTFLIEGISKKIGVWKFGRGNEVSIDGVIYPSTSESVIKLLSLGFSRTDVAMLFEVSEPTISNVMRNIKERGLVSNDLKG